MLGGKKSIREDWDRYMFEVRLLEYQLYRLMSWRMRVAEREFWNHHTLQTGHLWLVIRQGHLLIELDERDWRSL